MKMHSSYLTLEDVEKKRIPFHIKEGLKEGVLIFGILVFLSGVVLMCANIGLTRVENYQQSKIVRV